jgi:hypothetical protein
MDYRTITIGARTQYVVKVSPEDYDFLMQWPWTYAVSHPRHGGLVYARRSERIDGRNVTILMHRVIMLERMGSERPSLKHFTDHENGDSLDNRRVNDRGLQQLRWLTAKENMANQRGIRAQPVVPAVSAVAVGYSVLVWLNRSGDDQHVGLYYDHGQSRSSIGDRSVFGTVAPREFVDGCPRAGHGRCPEGSERPA